MAYLQWYIPQFFCSNILKLTFSFIFVLRFFSKNQRKNSTKNRTTKIATETATSKSTSTSTATATAKTTATSTLLSKCLLDHLMLYIWLAFPPFSCYVHFSLTFIFIVVRNLLCSFSLLLYHDTLVSWIFRTLHNTMTQTAATKKKRVGT